MFCIIGLWYKKGAYSVSEKQKEILEIIKTFINENGYSPTVREICALSGLRSTSSVHQYIKRLKAKGHLTCMVERPRSIVLTEKEKNIKFVVNAIALMSAEGKEYVLLQENKKQYANGSIFELPGGVIRESENVYGCLRRELKDNGFEVTKIFGEDKCNKISDKEEAVTVFKPFCVSQSFNDNNSIITSTIICEVDNEKVKNVNNQSGFRWVSTDNLKCMLVDHKVNICGHNMAALKSFCKV